MLTSRANGNKKVFQANIQHPLFSEIHNILLKHIGLDRIIENVIERLGDVDKVYLAGEFSRGIDSQIIDLVFIGDIDKKYLVNLIDKAEGIVKRKIRYLIYNQHEYDRIDWNKVDPEPLLVWSKD
ncbi:MAG: hypothetical protein AAFV95_19110 [Bacteroidota bacterium]